MKPDLTDTQIIILDTLRVILIRTTFRTASIDPALQAAVIAVLEEHHLTWSDLTEFSAK